MAKKRRLTHRILKVVGLRNKTMTEEQLGEILAKHRVVIPEPLKLKLYREYLKDEKK